MLKREFFEQDALTCARELIGTTLHWGKCAGIVVESEAYLVENDEACHTFFRPSTRAYVERNKAGTSYVYLNYGMHWMLNVLVKGGEPRGVILVRAIQPTRGIPVMKKRRGLEDERKLCAGPGRMTQALGITDADHEKDLCTRSTRCFGERERGVEVIADERIGITRAAHFPWRFTLAGSEFVSRKPKPAARER